MFWAIVCCLRRVEDRVRVRLRNSDVENSLIVQKHHQAPNVRTLFFYEAEDRLSVEEGSSGE